MNNDLISRADAIEAVQNRHMMLSKEKVLLINDLEELPSAEPSQVARDIARIVENEQDMRILPKMGRWIHHPEIGWGETWLCDQCGEKTTSTVMGKPRANFCPNCGADMRKTT